MLFNIDALIDRVNSECNSNELKNMFLQAISIVFGDRNASYV
jgi:hypothetical protein